MGLLWCCRLLQTTLRLSGQVQQLFTKNNSKPPQGLFVNVSSFTLVKPTQPQSAEKTRRCAMMKPSVEPPSGRPLLSLCNNKARPLLRSTSSHEPPACFHVRAEKEKKGNPRKSLN